jgi:hypothetical protein
LPVGSRSGPARRRDDQLVRSGPATHASRSKSWSRAAWWTSCTPDAFSPIPPVLSAWQFEPARDGAPCRRDASAARSLESDSLKSGHVRGREKVSAGGLVVVPGFGQLEVPGYMAAAPVRPSRTLQSRPTTTRDPGRGLPGNRRCRKSGSAAAPGVHLDRQHAASQAPDREHVRGRIAGGSRPRHHLRPLPRAAA